MCQNRWLGAVIPKQYRHAALWDETLCGCASKTFRNVNGIG